ncbi:sensor histidine kinase [Nonomuraea maheshkhaliensis]|uniref:sensor histidine kinase n=1 Tax=Nonomuraea maheshkhaliensis TaxID=419590 RepID=UPI0031F8A941
MGVVVGALQIASSISSAAQYQRIREKAELSAAITTLTHHLALERDHAVYFVATGRSRTREKALREQFAPVDAAIATVRDKAAAITREHGDGAWSLTQQILTRLPEIATTRDTAITSRLPALPTLTKYSQISDLFLRIHTQINQGLQDEPLSNSVRTLSALAKAKDAASQQRGLLAGVAAAGRFQGGELNTLTDARAQQDSEVAVFRSVATLDQQQFYDDTVAGPNIDLAELFRLRALGQANQNARLDLAPGRDDAGRWFEAMTDTIDAIRTVEKRMTESIIVQSRTLEEDARHRAQLAAALMLLLLLTVLVVTFLMAQSLVKPLRKLRVEALQIAGRHLPDTVRLLRDKGADAYADVTPIGVDSRDEIGEVARAFDEVHREAVRLAGEEARLRSNVNAMFVNLSRRSQTLVERQITLIDGLEQGEQDEQRLGNLFKLDHLATRMRRNSENLLVLAGQDPPRLWSRPVPLIDVARAALSEVEDYQRIQILLPGDNPIAGQAANDVVHLLAELIENALSFSPHDTPVIVSCNTIDSGGVLLSISDAGIGMTYEELGQANERLTSAPTVNVEVSRRMGLFVVARLAHRHGIRVQLRPHTPAGLTATVLLPLTLLAQPTGTYLKPIGTPFLTATSPAAHPAPVDYQYADTPHPFAPQPGSRQPSMPGEQPAHPASIWQSSPGPVTDEQQRPGRALPYRPQEWAERKPNLASPPTLGHSGRDMEAAATGPIPTVTPASVGDDYLPIFASVESAWFQRGNSDNSRWGSPQTDAGWSAAEAVARSVGAGSTTSGLPKRVPKANLVPGAAKTTATAEVESQPPVSPEAVRNRLSTFQQGCRAARDDISAGKINAADSEDGHKGTWTA